MNMKNIAFALWCLLLAVAPSPAHAIDFQNLECSALPTSRALRYNATISCTATVYRPGQSGWYNAPGWNCPAFCAAVGGINSPSPDGFSCTSGEERPWSAIGVINYAPTGCWHNCGFPEGIRGAISVGDRCYAPSQKRDYDRTDITVGCFCATGDVQSELAEVGIHASGSARTTAVQQQLFGWSSISHHTMNDRPGRIADVVGAIPLSGVAGLSFAVNVQGVCGESFAMSGRVNGSGGTSNDSKELRFAFPACAPGCSDGVDNDKDGLIDLKDPGCSSSNDNDESEPLSECQNGADDDNDGAIDERDLGCIVTKGVSELGEDNRCGPDSQADNSNTLRSLEEIARAQRDVVHAIASVIRRSQRNVTVRSKAQEIRVASTAAKHQLARALRKDYPTFTSSCSECPIRDLSAQRESFIAQSQKISTLTTQIAALYKEPAGGAAFSQEVNEAQTSAESLLEQFKKVTGELPNATRVCS